MPNIVGYQDTDDPAWIQVQFDDGSGMHVQDPTGSYRQEVDAISSKLGFQKPDTMAGATADNSALPFSSVGTGAPLPDNSGGLNEIANRLDAGKAGHRQTLFQPNTGQPEPPPVPAVGDLQAEPGPLVPLGAGTGDMLTPADQARLKDPSDLAALRNGLGQVSRAGGGSLSMLGGNRLAMPAAPDGVPGPLAGNRLAMPAPGDMGPPAPPAPTMLNAPGADDRAALAASEREHQHGLAAQQSRQQAEAERARAAREAYVAPGAPGPMLSMTPGTGPQVTTQDTRTTSGLDKASRAKIDAANANAINAGTDAARADNDARSQQVVADWYRLTDEQRTQLAQQHVHEQQERDLNQRITDNAKQMEADLSRKVDPSQAFAGDAGWYAFMAGFGDSLQNFGAALAGRGPVANPGATIDRIINRSVELQTAQKAADLKKGTITADQLNADRETIRARLLTVGKQLAETKLGKAKDEGEMFSLKAAIKDIDAKRAQAIAEAAKATATQEQNAHSRSVAPGTPASLSMFGAEKPQWDDVKSHYEKQAGADQVDRGASRAEKALGITWDERANNGTGGYIDKNGKIVNADDFDVPGATTIGATPKFLAGETGREVQGALEDLAAGGAKIKDPVGAVSDKSIIAEKDAMAANTDAGVVRALERTRRNLRSMRGGIDSAYSPGVVNASRLRRQQEDGRQNNLPGLPKTRAPRPDEL